MSDKTDINELRSHLVSDLDHVDSYGGKCWVMPEDVRLIIEKLDQLEAAGAKLAKLEPVAWGDLNHLKKFGYCAVFEDKLHVVGVPSALFTHPAPPDVVLQGGSLLSDGRFWYPEDKVSVFIEAAGGTVKE